MRTIRRKSDIELLEFTIGDDEIVVEDTPNSHGFVLNKKGLYNPDLRVGFGWGDADLVDYVWEHQVAVNKEIKRIDARKAVPT